MDLKIGDRIRVLVGVYTGSEGVVEIFAEGVEKPIGIKVFKDGSLMTTWFRPSEIECLTTRKIETEGEEK
jgi:hypothetical protein